VAASHDNSVDTTRDEDRPQRRVVLCIDDDTNALAIRRCLLENAGHFILTTHNGFDGLKIFSTGIADAVILDYAMPLINGGVVAAQMRQIKGEIPAYPSLWLFKRSRRRCCLIRLLYSQRLLARHAAISP
jgi:CheY-like chemotaxis protein